jgi:hypothetical protein
MARETLADRLTKEQLEKLYLKDGLSTIQIAQRFASNREAVRKLLKGYGIELRTRGAGKR